jgi:type II secretory pathway pseudopilin PulG
MAALLVALSVMAVLASAAMPAWKHMSQREKEAELVFRGQQYARAIGLFQRRAGPGVNPPNLDVLVQQKFLRKKYKDPITGGDFDLISPATQLAVPTAATPGTQTRGAPSGTTTPTTTRGGLSQPPSTPGRGTQPVGGSGFGAGSTFGGGSAFGAGSTVAGGIVGVQSKSKAESIRIYNGRTHYNEWQFVYIPQTGPGGRGQPGVPQPGVGQPGGPRRGGPQPGPFGGDGRFGNPPTFPQPTPGRQGGPPGQPAPSGPRGRGPFR